MISFLQESDLIPAFPHLGEGLFSFTANEGRLLQRANSFKQTR
jgi:hypothetical protein